MSNYDRSHIAHEPLASSSSNRTRLWPTRCSVSLRSTGVRPNTFPAAPHRERQQQQQEKQQGIPARLVARQCPREEFTTSSSSTQHDRGKPAVGGGPQQLSADLPATSAPAGRLPPQGEAPPGLLTSLSAWRRPQAAVPGKRVSTDFSVVLLSHAKWVQECLGLKYCVLVTVRPVVV